MEETQRNQVNYKLKYFIFYIFLQYFDSKARYSHPRRECLFLLGVLFAHVNKEVCKTPFPKLLKQNCDAISGFISVQGFIILIKYYKQCLIYKKDIKAST